jgi:hypothetical protein
MFGEGGLTLVCEADDGLVSGPPAEPATVSPASRRHAGRRSLPPSFLVSRGGRRAARFLAREARRSLHQGRSMKAIVKGRPPLR